MRNPGAGHRALTLTLATALAVPLAVASGGAALAQDDGKFCTGTDIVFFPGGTEGGGFETVVYNGAKAAERDSAQPHCLAADPNVLEHLWVDVVSFD